MFQVLAVVLLLAFYGCYFGKMAAQRKKGIQTDQMGKGKAGLAKGIELMVKLSALLVPCAEVVSIGLGVTRFPAPVRFAGVIVGLYGVTVFLISVLAMGDSWRAGVPKTDQTELVTGGVYQISRNPAFLGFDLVYIGILLMFFNWVLFAVSVWAMLMLHLQIVNVEEEFLLAAFGEEYLQYKKKVSRYLGRKR